MYNILLYCGLGMIMVGLVITVVGLGDKGFKSIELRLVGPGIVLCGGVITSARILLCTLPYTQCGGWCSKVALGYTEAQVDKDQTNTEDTVDKDATNTEETIKNHSRLGLERSNYDQMMYSGDVGLGYQTTGRGGVVSGQRQIIKPVRLAPHNLLVPLQKLEGLERDIWAN